MYFFLLLLLIYHVSIYPLFDGNPEKGKAAPKWISPIGINGTIVYENSVNAGDSLYNWANFNNLRKGARSGIRLNANASSSIKLFGLE
jgi:hypothetical protein